MPLPSALTGLRGKIIVAFLAAEVLAILIAGVVFVMLNRDDREQAALDRVAAASPVITAAFLDLRGSTADTTTVEEFVVEASAQHDVRVLVVDRTGTVVADSQSDITGKPIGLPAAARGAIPGRPSPRWRVVGHAERTPAYVRWRAPNDDPARGFVFFAASYLGRFDPEQEGAPFLGQAVIVGVPETSISRAWLDLLPGLALAGGVAFPVAILLAVSLGTYITRPLGQLTAASRHIAAGSFDVDVPVDGDDEIGELGRAFSAMATEVGRTNAEMRALIANVSHDLNTPLTSIQGFARALASGTATTPQDVVRMGGIIDEEAQRLSHRLRDLLLLSELDGGHMLLERDAVDMGRLVESVVERLALGDRRVEREIAPGIVVDADAFKLERVVENLLVNALRYAPADSPVTLRLKRHGLDARLEVTNAALGLDASELPRLFERFYRRDRTRRAGDRGTGLGLPIARDLVEMHGGTLEAAVRGNDIVFVVTLPLADGSRF